MKQLLIVQTMLAVVLITAAATIRAEVRTLKAVSARHEAYVYIHRQYIERLSAWEDTLQDCREWMEADSSGFEPRAYTTRYPN